MEDLLRSTRRVQDSITEMPNTDVSSENPATQRLSRESLYCYGGKQWQLFPTDKRYWIDEKEKAIMEPQQR